MLQTFKCLMVELGIINQASCVGTNGTKIGPAKMQGHPYLFLSQCNVIWPIQTVTCKCTSLVESYVVQINSAVYFKIVETEEEMIGLSMEEAPVCSSLITSTRFWTKDPPSIHYYTCLSFVDLHYHSQLSYLRIPPLCQI